MGCPRPTKNGPIIFAPPKVFIIFSEIAALCWAGIINTLAFPTIAEKGVDDGTRIRLSGKGEAGIKGSGNGDLYIFVSIRTHSIFKRSEENIFFEFPISLADAALGATVEVPTIDGGKAKVKIPAWTQNGKQFRLRGKGMPMMRNKNYGDLYIQVITEVPISLTKEQKSLLEQFKKIEDTKINPIMKDFFEKAKRFWKS